MNNLSTFKQTSLLFVPLLSQALVQQEKFSGTFTAPRIGDNAPANWSQLDVPRQLGYKNIPEGGWKHHFVYSYKGMITDPLSNRGNTPMKFTEWRQMWRPVPNAEDPAANTFFTRRFWKE